MKKLGDFVKGFLIVNVLWFLFAAILSTPVLPGPLVVYGRFDEVLSSGIWSSIAASLGRMAAGMTLSLAIGIPAGLLMVSSNPMNRLLHPFVYFCYPVPKTALLPVGMLLFGLGDGSKILIIVLTTVFQVMIAVRDAVLGIDSALYDVAQSAGAGNRRILWNITLPAVMPELFTSIRIGMGTSLAILMIVEAYGTRCGMGYFILDAWSRINYVQMYGGIVVMSVVGTGVFGLLDVVEKRVCRWKKIG